VTCGGGRICRLLKNVCKTGLTGRFNPNIARIATRLQDVRFVKDE
jgi:hypothetical protein